MSKKVVLAVVALVVVVGVAGGTFYGYQQIKARDACYRVLPGGAGTVEERGCQCQGAG